jgi:hypothetical protein
VTIIQLSFISGIMLGIEVRFMEPKAMFHYSLVVDLLIVRLNIQKLKNVG